MHRGFGTGFEDDAQDTNRTGDAVKLESVVESTRQVDAANGVRQTQKVADALENRLVLVPGKVEPFDQRPGKLSLFEQGVALPSWFRA